MPGPAAWSPCARHLDVGAFGEHRVEVRGDDQMRARRGARAVAEHVAGAIDADVLQAELRETLAAEPRRAPLP